MRTAFLSDEHQANHPETLLAIYSSETSTAVSVYSALLYSQSS